jgi:hypothetical protein
MKQVRLCSLTTASQGSRYDGFCLTGWLCRNTTCTHTRAGFGPSVVRDLSQHLKHVPQPCEALAKDVLRWLRRCSQGLVKHPRCVAPAWLPLAPQPVFAEVTPAPAFAGIGA